MKLRNISADTLQVPLLGVLVEPDEVVEISDDLAKTYDWPDTTWAVVGSSKKTDKAGE